MKFSSKPLLEHQEVPLADNGRLEDLVAHWKLRETPRKKTLGGVNFCYVVSLTLESDSQQPGARLDEILALVKAQGDEVVGHEALHVRRVDPRTLLGRGSCEDIARRARSTFLDPRPLIEGAALHINAPGGRPLFRELDLHIGRDKVALVGRNGVKLEGVARGDGYRQPRPRIS